MWIKNFVGLAAMACVLVSCAAPPKPLPPPPPPPPPPPHYGGAIANLCQIAPFSLPDGGSADVNMVVSNEGGYCAVRLLTSAGKPFDAPLVPVPPANGTAAVWKYDGKTSVEYQPNRGFTGTDNFVTKLKIAGRAGYTVLTVKVMVK